MKTLRTLLYIMLKIDRRGSLTTAISKRVAKRRMNERILDKVDCIINDMQLLHRLAFMSKNITEYERFNAAYEDKCTKDALFKHYSESTQHRWQ